MGQVRLRSEHAYVRAAFAHTVLHLGMLHSSLIGILCVWLNSTKGSNSRFSIIIT
jgi:hypothetical protein